jgi:hypothetical protein
VDVEMTGDAAGADGPTADHQQRHATTPAMAVPAQSASPGQAGPGRLLQFQLKQLIRGILAQQDLDPGIRMVLLRHLSQNPGHPEHALLAHLRAVQEPEDLPPFRACRKLTMQSSGS